VWLHRLVTPCNQRGCTWVWGWILLWALHLPAAAQAVQPQQLAVLIDPGGTETLASVSAPAAETRFRRVRHNSFSAGYTQAVYWLRFTLQMPAAGAWWLDVRPAVLDDLRLYEPVPGGHRQHHTGDLQPWATRELNHNSFVFKLDLPDTAPRTFYLRIQTLSSMQAQLTLWRPDDFHRSDRHHTAMLAFFLSIYAVLLVANLALWATLNQPLFGWFSLVLASYAAAHICASGLASLLLDGSDPKLANHALVLILPLALSSTAQLYRRLLRVPTRKRWLILPVRLQTVLPWLTVPAYFGGFYPVAMNLALAMTGLFALLMLLLALRQWRSRRTGMRPIALGCALSLAGGAVHTMGLLGLSEDMPPTFDLHLACTMGVMVAMQWALSTRILATSRQRSRLQLRAEAAERAAVSEQAAKDELAAVSARLNALVDELHHAQRLGKIGNWEWLLDADTFQGSEETYRMFGWRPGREAPQPHERAPHFSPDSWRRLNDAMAHTRQTGMPFVVELELAPGAGRARWIEGRGTLVVDAGGRVVRMRGTVQDISDRRRLVQAQTEAAATALASRSRNEFLARVSHEMRTPLNAVSGLAQLLALNPQVQASPDIAEQLRLMQTASDHLRAMIDDVLDLAQIRAGSLRLAVQAISIQALAVECLRWLDAQAAAHQVHLQLVDARQGWSLLADQTRMRQVLMNLLSNAIKYNRPGGSVVLTLRHEPAATAGAAGQPDARPTTAPAAGWLCVEVADTGRGMNPRQMSALYEPFNRLGAEQEEIPGTGLGLSLVKELTEAMGGTLEAHSALGQGSQFRLRLPAQAAAEDADLGLSRARGEAPDVVLDAPGAPFLVLYVEDNRLNAMVMQLAIKRLPGVVLHIATDGNTGLAMARQLQPDLVLLDINLPQLSGTEVMLQLRADPTLAHTPCVAVSANSIAVDVEQAIGAGFDDYIAKPIAVQPLLQLVQRMRQTGQPRRSRPQRTLFE
jgi:signal transduction histidine kinase/ActR/RegA family two-component response regulator